MGLSWASPISTNSTIGTGSTTSTGMLAIRLAMDIAGRFQRLVLL